MKGRSHRIFRGFTLLETLVAMVVLAIGLAALWKGLGQAMYVSHELPNRIMARWVAQNHLVSRQIMSEWPDVRTYTGTDVMGGHEWHWEEQVSNTDINDIRRITVQVGKSADSILLSLDGFLYRP